MNLTEYFLKEFYDKHNISLDKNEKAVRRLYNQCEILKCKLTFEEIATIEIDCFYNDGNKYLDLNSSLDRETFNQINTELFDKTINSVQEALKDANKSKEDIDEIILVGGSSKIPRVKEIIKEFFNKK